MGTKKPRGPRKSKVARQPVQVPARAPGFTAHDVATAFVLRSSLRSGLGEGDVGVVGRAIARLRVDGAGVLPAELIAARLVRAERAARDAAARDVVAATTPRHSPRPAVFRAMVAVGVLLVVAQLPAAIVPSASQDSPPSAAAAAGVLAPPVLESRGRSTATLPPVAVATPEATPASTPAPEPTAAPQVSTPVPVVRIGVPAGVIGGVPGGAVGGVPGGVVGGTGSVKPVATPTPTPMPVALLVPSTIPTGYSRLTLMVLDHVTGQPLPGVCVILGTGSCGPSKPQTNALGLWWLDYPSGSARFWDISLVDPRYRTVTTRVVTGGTDQTVQVRLQR